MRVLRCVALLAIALPAVGTAQPSAPVHPMTSPSAPFRLKSLAPVLIVDAVEPAVSFWTDRLGFSKDNLVPGPDGKLIFASVKRDGIEIMYQTKASVLADDPAGAADLVGHSTALFFMVPSIADLDVLERQTKGAPVTKPRHDTFYGTTEFYIREPGGNVVGFAAPKA